MWSVQNHCRVHLCKGERRVLFSPLSCRHSHSCPSPPPAPALSNFCLRLNDHTIVLSPVAYHLSLGLCSVYSVSLMDAPHLLVEILQLEDLCYTLLLSPEPEKCSNTECFLSLGRKPRDLVNCRLSFSRSGWGRKGHLPDRQTLGQWHTAGLQATPPTPCLWQNFSRCLLVMLLV